MRKRVKMARTDKMMSPAEYLRRPYGRLVVPEADGTFRGEIIEFPGCIAVGDTAAEALANLEDVAANWLEATIAKGQRVPDPLEDVEFSGKLVVRLPKSLHKKAAYLAQHEGVSLNQFIVSSVAEQVGAQSHQRLSGARDLVFLFWPQTKVAVTGPNFRFINANQAWSSGNQVLTRLLPLYEASHAGN
jgi:predicted RNase H-like HicB family nuclease